MFFKGLLADLDGTILDTTDLIVESFVYTFKKHYNRVVAKEEVYAFFGKPLRDAMVYLGPDKVEELIATYREYNHLHHDQLAKVFSDVPPVVQKLGQAGIPLAIVTSKTEKTAVRGLHLYHLDCYFKTIIGADQCIKHKPDPEPVERALQQLGLKPEECLMIGDSPFDIISGKKAGVKTAAVRWTYVPWSDVMESKPDFVIHNMYELLNFFAGVSEE